MMKWTVAVLLFGCLSAVNGRDSDRRDSDRRDAPAPTPPSTPSPTSGCSDPSTSIPCFCTDPALPFAGILSLIGQDNDNDASGGVTSADIVSDVSKNYDTNNDGLWSEEECVTRWSCRYAGDYSISNYICSLLFRGEQNTSISSFNNIGAPFDGTGMPLANFLEMNKGRYDQYSQSNCVKECLTIAQKADLNAINNDYNNDGMVTGDNVEDDLTNNYDTDNNGIVTKAEWVTGFVCAYGDSAAYARYLFDLTAGQDINITAAGQRFQTVTVGARNETFRQRYDAYVQTINPFYEYECTLYKNRQQECSQQYLCQNAA